MSANNPEAAQRSTVIRPGTLRPDPAILSSIQEPPILGLDDAEKCWVNAWRLFRDASLCSTSTKTALIELGLEETAKAGMILFRRQLAAKIGPDGSISIPRTWSPF
ncbi:MAG: hypothetical protein L3K17_03110 [Thermoplasmata archaeon]|nr:hypothetical protein [Thermoplasmata archaeon]